MPTLEVLIAQRAELDKLIKEATEKKSKEAREVWAKIKQEYDYTVEWYDEYSLRISRVLSTESKERVAKFKTDYPNSGVHTGDDNTVQGMSYYLHDTKLVASGGGYVMAREDGYDPLHNRYANLSEEELGELKKGNFPASLAYRHRW